MEKILILVLIFLGFFFVFVLFFKKQEENIEMVQNGPGKNEIESLPSSLQYNGIIDEDLLRPQKTPEESIPVDAEKGVITLSKPTVTDEIRGEEDSNGVRHDVNLWIAEQPITYEQKLALIQQVRCLQNELVQSERLKELDVEPARKEVEKMATESLKALDCIFRKFKEEDQAYAYKDQMRALILNSEKRVKADEFIDEAFSGGAIYYPQGETCE